MSYQYYAMDFGEILWLLLVLSLWILSIVCCIKRYEKISTIERADMISRDKVINKELSASTSANNQTSNLNSTNNLKVVNSNTNLASHKAVSIHDQLNSKHIKLKDNGYIPNNNNNSNKYNYKQFKNVLVIDETNNTKPKTKKVNKLSKQNSSITTKTKSNSEPALTNLLKTQATNLSNTRSISIDNYTNRFLIKSTSSLLYDYNVQVTKRVSIISNHQPDMNHLIDPRRIPRIIRKSLLDLHKKSMLNVSHHNSSGNNLDTNVSSVFTQQRHKNEIKMRVNKAIV